MNQCGRFEVFGSMWPCGESITIVYSQPYGSSKPELHHLTTRDLRDLQYLIGEKLRDEAVAEQQYQKMMNGG